MKASDKNEINKKIDTLIGIIEDKFPAVSLKAQRVKDRDEVKDILNHYLSEDELFKALEWLDKIYKGV